MLLVSDFEPAFWLKSPHAQTIYASKLRPRPELVVEPERVELDDGDFLDLSWLPERGLADDAPIVIVLHGLNGNLESKYARGILHQIDAHNARGVLMHFRGASGPNRLTNSYHSGKTDDLGVIIDLIRRRYPRAPISAVGYSLGGNVLLKYLGEQGAAAHLACATAVSIPFDLAKCADAVNHGLSRIYRSHLINGMREAIEEKFSQMEPPYPMPDLKPLRDFQSFDDAVTAPLNGFESAQDYYTRASSGPYLKSIRVPTLILQARDDPFMADDIIPSDDELSDAIRFELSDHGGHVGFIAAGRMGEPLYWLEERIPAWLESYLPDFVAVDETASTVSQEG